MRGPPSGYQGRWRVVCHVIRTTQFPCQFCEAVLASWIWQQFWSLNICSLQALVMIHTDRRIGSRKTGSPYNPNYSHRKRQQQQQKSTSLRPRPWILPLTCQPSSTVSNGVSKKKKKKKSSRYPSVLTTTRGTGYFISLVSFSVVHLPIR